jgi:hypothetical protein
VGYPQPGDGIMANKKCEHDRVSCSICSPEKVFRQYEYKAKKRNLTFRLTLAEFEVLVNARCHWCGQYGANGVDRVDNRIGYIGSNCVAACMECNFAKRVMTSESFVRMAIRIAEHQKKIAEQKKKMAGVAA